MPVLDEAEVNALSAALALETSQPHARATAKPVSLIGAESARRGATLQRAMDAVPAAIAHRVRMLTRRSAQCTTGALEELSIEAARENAVEHMALGGGTGRLRLWLVTPMIHLPGWLSLVTGVERSDDGSLSALERRMLARCMANVMADVLEATRQAGLALPSITTDQTELNLSPANGRLRRLKLDIIVEPAQPPPPTPGAPPGPPPEPGEPRTLGLWLLLQGDPGAPRKGTHSASAIAEVEVDVTVELGATKTTLAAVSRLQVGDIIALDTNDGEPMRVRVGEVPKFYARVDQRGGRLQAQIVVKSPAGRPMSPVKPSR